MKRFIILTLFTFAASLAAEANLIPISYSMQNGEYGYVGGYGDNTYTSSDCPGCPGFLSGGLGELTDGHTVVSFFGQDNFVSMVGWGSPGVTISVFFDGTQNFGAVGLHLADAHGAAGIGLPLTVTINAGTPQVFTPQPQNAYPDTSNEWHWFDLEPGTSGSSLTIHLDRNDGYGPWMFMDEMSFLSASETTGAPEPGTLALLAGGIALAGYLKKRKA